MPATVIQLVLATITVLNKHNHSQYSIFTKTPSDEACNLVTKGQALTEEWQETFDGGKWIMVIYECDKVTRRGYKIEYDFISTDLLRWEKHQNAMKLKFKQTLETTRGSNEEGKNLLRKRRWEELRKRDVASQRRSQQILEQHKQQNTKK